MKKEIVQISKQCIKKRPPFWRAFFCRMRAPAPFLQDTLGTTFLRDALGQHLFLQNTFLGAVMAPPAQIRCTFGACAVHLSADQPKNHLIR